MSTQTKVKDIVEQGIQTKVEEENQHPTITLETRTQTRP